MVAHEDTPARRFRELERQVHDLAASRRAAFTSIVDENGDELVRFSAEGVMTFEGGVEQIRLDGDGVTVSDGATVVLRDGNNAEIGRLGQVSVTGLDGTTQETGIRIQRADGTRILFITGERGLITPEPQFEWRNVEDPKLVTSGTFATQWQAIPRYLTADGLTVEVAVGSDASTTGEVRLQAIASGGGTFESSAIAISAGSAPDYRTFKWDLGSLGFEIGDPLFVNVQARRTGGSGDVRVYQPLPLLVRDAAFIGATATGV